MVYYLRMATTADGAFLRVVLEALSHPFYVINVKDYSISLANSAARLGALTEASTCHALTHHSAEPCAGDHPCPLLIVRATGRPTVVEHVHYDRDGVARNIEVHAFPIFDASGELVQMIEYGLDITARKQMEAERDKVLAELQRALANVRALSGMLPICAACKKIRDDKGYWNQIEVYIRDHSEADFSHSICPECVHKLYPELRK